MNSKHAILPLFAAALLASCGGNAASSEAGSSIAISSSEAESSSAPSSSSEDLSSSSSAPLSSSQEPLANLPDVDYDIGISIDSYLSDFSVGTSAIVGKRYNINGFNFTKSPNEGAYVTTDRPEIMEPVQVGGKWYLDVKAPGQSHLMVWDADEVLHYRQVITAKPEVGLDDIIDVISDVDHWEVLPAWQYYCGDFSAYFFDDGSCELSGIEGGGSNLDGATFTIEHDDSVFAGSYYDDDLWYGFVVNGWNLQDFNLSFVAVLKTGDYMHLHTANAVLGILGPVEAK